VSFAVGILSGRYLLDEPYVSRAFAVFGTALVIF
jgi:hypothetical protein